MRRPYKRQKILSAAVTLFRRTHNVKRVSIETIAAEAGVSPTTIYSHFGTRENLVGEVVRVLIHELVDAIRLVLRSDLPFPRKLAELVSAKIVITGQYNGEVLIDLLSQNRLMAASGQQMYLAEVRPLMLEFLTIGKKQGYIDPSIDDKALITYFEIWQAGMANKPEIAASLEENMLLFEQLTDLAFYGFLRKDAKLFDVEKSLQPSTVSDSAPAKEDR